MALLRILLQELLVYLKLLSIWMMRPRIRLLILLFIVIGGGTWLYFDQPTLGVALKTFVLKTLPKWYSLATKIVLSWWPKIIQALIQSARKKYIKGILLYLAIHILTQGVRLWLRKTKNTVVHKVTAIWTAKYNYWWKEAELGRRIMVVATIVVIIVSIPSLHFLGWFILPLALIWQVLMVIWKFIITRLGAGAVVDAIQNKIIDFVKSFFPNSTVANKWQRLRKIANRRRKLFSQAKKLKEKSKKVLQVIKKKDQSVAEETD